MKAPFYIAGAVVLPAVAISGAAHGRWLSFFALMFVWVVMGVVWNRGRL